MEATLHSEENLFKAVGFIFKASSPWCHISGHREPAGMFRGTPTSPARSSRRWDRESCASAFCANPKSVLSQGHEGRHVAAGSQRGAVPISELDLAQKTPKKAQLAVSVGSAVREVDLGQEARVQLFFFGVIP